MKIAVDITHPAHVHFFKNAIEKWRARGHFVYITSRGKDIALQLLDALGLRHHPLSSVGSGPVGLGLELLTRGYKATRILSRVRPDICTAISGTFISPVGRLLGIPVVVFSDTEHAGIANDISFSCASIVISPECYRGTIRYRQARYRGYHELAYLHPLYFSPDPKVLKLLGVEAREPFVIMRFVGWGASHDTGHSGLTIKTRIKAATEFSKHARVFITSEKPLPAELVGFKISIPAELIHHALYYATLLYGESATMASECAVLGTPAIYVDFTGRGYTDEQEAKYGAVFNFGEGEEEQRRSVEKGMELLNTPDVKRIWVAKRKKLLEDTIDVTSFVGDLIENFPDFIESDSRILKGPVCVV